MKRFFAKILIVAGLMVFAVALARGFFFASWESMSSAVLNKSAAEKENTAKEKIPDSYPKKLRAPSIGIDADIQYKGITRKGNVGAPDNYRDVAWYKNGVAPGKPGNAVISGHVNNGFSLPGVFAKLEDLKHGDIIYVETAGGNILSFKVTGMEIYDYDASVGDMLNEEKKNPGLILITCAGTWLKDIDTHDKRLVVTAEMEV